MKVDLLSLLLLVPQLCWKPTSVSLGPSANRQSPLRLWTPPPPAALSACQLTPSQASQAVKHGLGRGAAPPLLPPPPAAALCRTLRRSTNRRLLLCRKARDLGAMPRQLVWQPVACPSEGFNAPIGDVCLSRWSGSRPCLRTLGGDLLKKRVRLGLG